MASTIRSTDGPGPAEPWNPGRSGTAHASSARSLLLSVLGEFVLPDGGSAWTSTLVAALAALGVEERAARQALARSGRAGLLTPARAGRATRWSLTPEAAELLDTGAATIYRFGGPAPAWNHRWLLLLVTVPEGDRHLRHRLRARLGWLGFATLAGGVWISPWTDREEQARAVLAGLGLDAGARAFVAEGGSLGDPAASVGQVWPLEELAARYRAFLASWSGAGPAAGEESFAAVVGLVHEWRTFPSLDPALPDSLLPGSWPGPEAARVFADRRRAWSGPAWAWWRAQGGS